MCTNGIVSLYYGETAQKFEPCLCNEAHNERREWHDSYGVPLFNAFGQEMKDVSININLLMNEEIVLENCPWSKQCRQVGDRIQVVDHHES